MKFDTIKTIHERDKVERFYKILGISSTASKDEIKQAYRNKMKALHPDKVHGTNLEDTASFFATEINEAYEFLMLYFGEKVSRKSSHEQSGYFEEEIFIGDHLLKYSFANNFDIIKNVIYAKIGENIDIDELNWKINPNLSINVKNAMASYKVNYSMAFHTINGYKCLVINRRYLDKWFFSDFVEVNGFYYNNDRIQRMNNNHQQEVQKLKQLKQEIERERNELEWDRITRRSEELLRETEEW